MNMEKSLPVIGVTMGDPSGIGPEIVVKALLQPEIREICVPVVIGDSALLGQAAAFSGMKASFVPWQPGFIADQGAIAVLETGVSCAAQPVIGGACKIGGQHALAAIETAADLALSGAISAMVTAPISKESIRLAGCKSPGHTDLLAQLCGTRDYAMMLVAKRLHVFHVTTHIPLAQVSLTLNEELIYRRIRLASQVTRELELANPTVAVCGFNPHAGENGLMGVEEMDHILPAINRANAEGFDCSGPYPSDTIFVRAVNGEFQMILAMYHDQGHIPVKILGLMNGVNVTVGLPIIRTSVDHGTAYGKAGQGKADPGSLIAAIKLAVDMAYKRDARQAAAASEGSSMLCG